MNDRIMQLAAQAELDVQLTRNLSDGSVERTWRPEHFYQRFAELIVKECVDTLEFHGCEEAISYIKWVSVNKWGMK
jgi:hypothetical protein